MAPEPARAPIAALLASLGAMAAGCGWEPGIWSGAIELEPPNTSSAELTAVAVATLDAPVKARRGGRVLELRVRTGDVVAEGDALIEFEDLALEESKAAVRREIEELTAAHAAAGPTPAETARSASRDLRTAAISQLEETHSRASEEFERWTELFEEGLLARLDFEEKQQEFEALSTRLREARAAAQEPEAEVPSEPADLRRSQRLLERLQELPKTYLVESLWDGTVNEVLVAVGDMPERGAAVATVARAALPMLVAEITPGTAVVAIEEACGVPGPLAFSRREATLELAAPTPRLRPGDECVLALSIRE
ncbi:MAG: biotin/lipoyl-binding protein [Acidobacteriia bacterium]|nr:biotin/lipoyl-binding protein [Terriglobia bacterium]